MNPTPAFDEHRLISLVTDPETTFQQWNKRAACAEQLLDNDAYFPANDELPPADALELCFGCPVSTECLATALIHESQSGYRDGWWGSTGPDAREAIASRLGIETRPVELDARGPADLAQYLRSQNHTIPEIAAELGCSERTVHRYLADSAA